MVNLVSQIQRRWANIVIEIGPGLGALTQHLIGKVKKLILIEFDKISIQLKKKKIFVELCINFEAMQYCLDNSGNLIENESQ